MCNCAYSLGFLGDGASNDSGVVDDIFGELGGYVVRNFGDKDSIIIWR